MKNGIIRDSRWDVQLWSAMSSNDVLVTLPSGKALTVITDDTNLDNLVARSSCYWVAIDSAVTNYMDVQQALVTALIGKKAELSSNKFNVSVQIVGNEEYVNKRG